MRRVSASSEPPSSSNSTPRPASSAPPGETAARRIRQHAVAAQALEHVREREARQVRTIHGGTDRVDDDRFGAKGPRGAQRGQQQPGERAAAADRDHVAAPDTGLAQVPRDDGGKRRVGRRALVVHFAERGRQRRELVADDPRAIRVERRVDRQPLLEPEGPDAREGPRHDLRGLDPDRVAVGATRSRRHARTCGQQTHGEDERARRADGALVDHANRQGGQHTASGSRRSAAGRVTQSRWSPDTAESRESEARRPGDHLTASAAGR